VLPGGGGAADELGLADVAPALGVALGDDEPLPEPVGVGDGLALDVLVGLGLGNVEENGTVLLHVGDGEGVPDPLREGPPLWPAGLTPDVSGDPPGPGGPPVPSR